MDRTKRHNLEYVREARQGLGGVGNEGVGDDGASDRQANERIDIETKKASKKKVE